MRVLVRNVVADYSERPLASALPPIADPESVVRDVLDRVAGFGPQQRHLDAAEVEGTFVDSMMRPDGSRLHVRISASVRSAVTVSNGERLRVGLLTVFSVWFGWI